MSRRAVVMKELGLSPVWVRRQGSGAVAPAEPEAGAAVQAAIKPIAPSAESKPAADRATQIQAMEWMELQELGVACFPLQGE